MNKREENFEKVAMDYCEDHSHCIYFEAGAEHGYQYAMQHPNWIPVDRELPKPNIYQDCKTFPLVLVCLNDGCEDTDAYDTDNKAWCKYDSDVEYWMEMPPVPRKEGKNDH